MKRLAIIILAIWMVMLCGCTSTITPKPVDSTQIGIDGNVQNGGILGPDCNGGFTVTSDFRARYNALIAIYGKRIIPPLKPDDGITLLQDGTTVIDRQHMVDEILMSDWHRMGRAP